MSNYTTEELDELFATEVPEHSIKFTKEQNAGPRVFVVSGPKADKVRALIFADQNLTRKQIADIAECSVSRVGEVVWGLEHDELDFPAIPLRALKVAEVTEENAEAVSTDVVETLERGLAAS
jgi:hypothetical protein